MLVGASKQLPLSGDSDRRPERACRSRGAPDSLSMVFVGLHDADDTDGSILINFFGGPDALDDGRFTPATPSPSSEESNDEDDDDESTRDLRRVDAAGFGSLGARPTDDVFV